MYSDDSKFYKLTLHDGKDYIFDFNSYNNWITFKKSRRIWKVKATKDISDEDWKTALAQNKPSIPTGTELQVVGVLENLYGRYIEAYYQGSLYYINPRDVDYVGSEVIETNL